MNKRYLSQAVVDLMSLILVLHLTAGTGWAAETSPGPARSGSARPNIVLILADDLGWTDLSCAGSGYYQTPNIDRLGREGMRFTEFHVSQNCAPTRACLMSGQYAPRTGVYTVGSLERGSEQNRRMNVPRNREELPLDRMTVANALKDAGYATAMFGKWHLGQQGAFHPGRRGFDEAVVSMGRHYNFVTNPRVEVPKDAYLADFLTDRAVRFMEKNKDRPFFLYLPHFAVHVPLEAKPDLIERFKSRPAAGGHKDPVYAAMIGSLDESVGRVLAKLDELKLSDRTVVIFTSDNGGVGGYEAAGINANDNTDNRPLRAGKGTLYEGGIRVPFLVRYPPLIRQGGVCDTPAVHVDLFPTFLELAGGGRPNQVLDGVSLMPLFKDPRAGLDRDAVFWHFPGYLEARGGGWRTTPVSVIRSGDFKLMEFLETGRLELYNLREDIGEKKNLADAMPDKAKELHGRLEKWRKDSNAAMPTLKRPSSAQASAGERP